MKGQTGYSYSFLHLNVKFTKLWLCLWRVFFRSSLWTDSCW
uniref:ORF40a n=1 Tax=Pinus thunbergii TaxID=3350 RepID=Q32946_PINTH|nr:ORF40a [Pinus thunbergii]